MTDTVRQPAIAIPPVTGGLVLLLAVIQIVRVAILSPDQDTLWVIRLGLIPAVLAKADFSHIWPWTTLLTYAVLHFGWTHFIVNATGLLAFGAAIERAFGVVRYVIILLIGIVAGAVLHMVFFTYDQVVLGGISAGLSTLFAVIIGLLQQKRGWRGVAVPALIWVILNVVVGLMGMPGQPGLAIGWLAHLGGFIAGLACLPILMPVYQFWKTDMGTNA